MTKYVSNIDISDNQLYLDHLTLIHSENCISNRTNYNKLLERRGAEMTIEIDTIHWSNNDTVVYSGNLFDSNCQVDNQIVDSGYPHITSLLPKDMSPYQSVQLLKEDNFQNKRRLDKPLIIKTHVTFYTVS